MRMTKLAAIVAICTPLAALADPLAPPAPAAPPETALSHTAPTIESAGARPGEALICHYYYYQGAIVRRPICKTEHEWIRYRLQQQADVNQFELRSYQMQK
jgi:hypothetical protein